ncbi:hypothetical protein PM8797T_18444 [Gimesia maris DSM 8797]|nr:hypothetical protein PM8797T_18444 [Gimesia maris DSM 8797]
MFLKTFAEKLMNPGIPDQCDYWISPC